MIEKAPDERPTSNVEWNISNSKMAERKEINLRNLTRLCPVSAVVLRLSLQRDLLFLKQIKPGVIHIERWTLAVGRSMFKLFATSNA